MNQKVEYPDLSEQIVTRCVIGELLKICDDGSFLIKSNETNRIVCLSKEVAIEFVKFI